MERPNAPRPERAQQHEGERYLTLLGLDHLADRPIPGYGIKMRDFLDICGEHARPALRGLESLTPADPRFAPTREALRGYIAQFVEQ